VLSEPTSIVLGHHDDVRPRRLNREAMIQDTGNLLNHFVSDVPSVSDLLTLLRYENVYELHFDHLNPSNSETANPSIPP